MPAIHSITLGSGPDVVLLHPFPLTHEFWLPVAHRLADTYRVTLYDLRGLGRSTDLGDDVSMQTHAYDLSLVCKQNGIERAVFGGCSIGGYILFEFLRRHREQVKALVLCDTRSEADTEQVRQGRLKSIAEIQQHGAEPFFEAMEKRLLSESTLRDRRDIVEEIRAIMRRNGVAGLVANLQAMATRPDYSGLLQSIDFPTLLVFGKDDMVTPADVAHGLKGRIAKSQLNFIQRAGHLACFEGSDDAVGIVRKFLEALPS